MPHNANHRFNPFTGQIVPAPIVNEPNTVRFLDEWGIYGFILQEVPTIQSGSNTLNITLNPGGTLWTEIDSSLDPSPTEYRVDRKFKTGLVEFNPGDDGKSFLVSYSGEGTVLSIENFRGLVLSQLNTGGQFRAGLMEDGTPFFRRIFRGTQTAVNQIHNISFGPYVSTRKVVGAHQGWYIGNEVHLTGGANAFSSCLIRDDWIFFQNPAGGSHEWFVTIDHVL